MLDRRACPVLSLALLAVAWAVARACVQSITMDEAMTWRAFVDAPGPAIWIAHSNNHILNSLLMRWSVALFGLSQLSVRLPALAGSVLYIAACAWLCLQLTSRGWLRLVSFAGLVFNPFIADYYAVARGYSMALGFLMLALAIVYRYRERYWILSSVLIGLTFVASFPFAFVAFAAWLAMLAWIRPGVGKALAGAAAGSGIVALIAGWTLAHWTPGQLFDGARSLRESLGTVLSATLHDPTTAIANPAVADFARAAGPYLLALIALAAIVQLVRIPRQEIGLVAVAAGAALGAFLLHWIAFRLFGLHLPWKRTAVYLAPLLTLAVCAIAALELRPVLTVLLTALGLYFGLCLRINYSWEWWLSADMKDAYYAVAWLNHHQGVTTISTAPPFTDCLEFYRRASGNETLAPVTMDAPYVPATGAWVFYESQNHDRIAAGKLRVVYRGAIDSDVVVAVSAAPDSLPGIDDADSRIQFQGSWTHDRSFGQASAGTVSYSNVPGDSATFRFTGSGLRYIYTAAPNRGLAQVLVDGRPAAVIDLYSPAVVWHREHRLDHLGPGDHTFELRVLGRHNPASTGVYVDLDALAPI